MNDLEIAHVVAAVLRELGQLPDPTSDNSATNSDQVLPPLMDLGSEQARNWIGVSQPKNEEVVMELKRSTRARVGAGRAGPRPRTQSLLRFLADHSRSKDTVLSEIAPTWVGQAKLFELQTQITAKEQYLTRPDLGRLLAPASVTALLENCTAEPDVQLIVSDGLSTEATTSNFDDIVPSLLRGLNGLKLKVGTPLFVRFGRVKVEDQIGELLKAKVVILLIGERPGLGQSESLSCYMVYQPTQNTVEADRTCISNIHRGGTPPVEAAAVIVEMASNMLKLQASGIAFAKKMAVLA